MATAVRRAGRIGDEAAELRRVTAGDLAKRLFALIVPCRAARSTRAVTGQ